jgi:hypothetical protein
MRHHRKALAATVIGACCLLVPRVAIGQVQQPPAPDAAKTLTTTPPLQAADELRAMLQVQGLPGAENVRFALGIAQTLSAVEQLGRGLYLLGPRGDTLVRGLPILRLPVPDNPDPPVVKLDDLNRLLEDFAANLERARQTLAAVKGEVQLTIPITELALDFNADGVSDAGERLGSVLFELRMVNPRPAGAAAQFYTVDFDYADVQWLIAYTHLLSGLAEFMLAWDGRELFEHAGHLIFKRVQTPHDFLVGDGGFDLTFESIADFAAFLHTARFPVRDAARLEKARQHMLSAIEGSRRTMQLIQGESDRGREWIPGPKQKAALPNVQVTQEVVDAWLAFLDDAEGVLEGRTLIPFWRADDGRGVNLLRALAEPRDLDLVLWIQGTAAVPYLERDKPLATGASFRQMQRVTAGNFWTFAAWFN